MIWEAELSNWGRVTERDGWVGDGSPWMCLKDFIEYEGGYMKNLALVHGNDRYEAKPDADGYWYARGSWVNMNTREQTDRYGIGWVDKGVLFIMWVMKTGASWEVKTEARDPSTQQQIIWSKLPV